VSSENQFLQSDEAYVVDRSVQLRPTSQKGEHFFTARIVSSTQHTFSITIPFDHGKILLWPVGAILEVFVTDPKGNGMSFTSELIRRDIAGSKTYTLMRPSSISRAGRSSGTAENANSRVVAITSGKGGVGKTTLTASLAVALTALGKRVFVIDADLGTANMDIVLGLSPKFNLTHLITGERSLLEIAVPAPGGFALIPGGSGLQELTQLSESQFSQVIRSFNQLEDLSDFILLDTGAGISRDVSNFLLASDEIIVVTTPEPHAITDAYAINKVMTSLGVRAPRKIIINRVDGELEASVVSSKLKKVVRQYLNDELEFLGGVREDRAVTLSLKKQSPLLLFDPDSNAAKDIVRIAGRLSGLSSQGQGGGVRAFVDKLIGLYEKLGIKKPG
jgi:flagellar biosynthesis protein FlhG